MTPLEQLAAALDGALPGSPAAFGVQVGEPAGPGWTRLADADVAAWCVGGDAAAALGVAELLGTAALGRVVAALALTGRAFAVAELLLHRHELGFLDAAALPGGAALLGVDDAAASAVAVLGPLLAAVVGATRPAPLWDAVADAARGAASTLTLHHAVPAHEAADAFVAALAAHGAPLRPAGPRQPVATAGRTYEVAVRVTCCLLWTGVPAPERTAAYCTTCPHLEPAVRAERWRGYVEARG